MSLFIKKKSKNTNALYVKYFLFTIWIGAIITGYVKNGFYQTDLSYGMSDVPFERKIILTIGALVITVPLTAIFGQYASCKYICWQAPFMIIGTKIRDYFRFSGLRLKAKAEECKSCKICTKECSMNIDVMANVNIGKMDSPECILCGKCIDYCKHQVIKFAITK